ncbi:MAG: flagellin FliC, partial [Nitrospinaceae bacterium]|nr:flagellin FliC [Nitrospinaceae bacterium]NIR54746.1 flagellin FliC [Nitrospinaceae bacterium]NIS85171.1 flagellin FliC [Nitrospinaceae bacterium]NIT81984.1 flagellin FliC [Nitrospinaceae bacterium]NIU44245.1 flagellin FliC [Nitrospinaceae bacterium]
ALNAMGSLTKALDQLNKIRGRLGAAQNRFVRALNNQNTSIEGLTRAVST